MTHAMATGEMGPNRGKEEAKPGDGRRSQVHLEDAGGSYPEALDECGRDS